jgi:O-antigen/teichoic acid export membrane protein
MSLLLIGPLSFVFEYVFDGIQFNPYVILAILISSIDPVNKVYFAYLQIKKDIKNYAIFYNLYCIGRILVLLLIAVIFKSVEYYFYTYLIFVFIFSLVSIYRLDKVLKWNFNTTWFYEAISYSIYYLPVILISRVNSLIDRTYVLNKIDIENVGIYSLGSSIGQVVYLLATVLNMAYVPFFIESYEKDKSNFIPQTQAYSELTVFILNIFSLSVSILLPILGLFLSQDYHSSLKVVPYFLYNGVAISLYFYFTNFLSLEKKLMKYKVLGVLVGAFINIFLSYFLIDYLGIVGAAIGTIISTYLSVLVLRNVCIKKGGFLLSYKFILASLVIMIAGLGIEYLYHFVEIHIYITLSILTFAIVLYSFDEYFFYKRGYVRNNLINLFKNVKTNFNK